MPIAWTKTSRSKLTATRQAHKGNPTDLAFTDAAIAWSWMRTRRAQNATNECTINATSEFAPLLNAVLKEYENEAPPKVRDPQHELMRMIVLSHDGSDCYPQMSMSFRALVALWLHQGGPSFIPTLFDVDAPFAFVGSYSGSKSELSIQPLEPNPHGHKSLTRLLNGGLTFFELPFWMSLRALLFAAPEKLYQSAVETFTPRREALLNKKTKRDETRAGHEQSYMDFAFSRDPRWATEDANALLKGAQVNSLDWCFVLAGLTDGELALKLVKLAYLSTHTMASRGHDLIESLGESAAPVLKAFIEKQTRLDAKTKKQLESLYKLAGG